MTKEGELKTPGIVKAPFTEEQLKALKIYQEGGLAAPELTCGNRMHLRGGPILKAMIDGLYCLECGNLQIIVPEIVTNLEWVMERKRIMDLASENANRLEQGLPPINN